MSNLSTRSDAALAARTGAMWLTGAPDGPPLTPANGLVAAAERAAERARSASPGLPLDGPAELVARSAIESLGRRAPSTVGGSGRAIECRDGWAAVNLSRAQDLASIPAVVEDGSAEPGLQTLQSWARGRTADGVVDRLRLLEIPSARVPLGDIVSSVAAAATTAVSGSSTRTARRLGERPVVVDLSALWAGPLCGAILTRAGYRVIKVESSGRPDGARAGTPRFFDYLHHGQESVVLDFTSDSGRRALASLLSNADVVIEASRPRALRSLGLHPESLLRSGGVWVSLTAYGRGGETENLVGFGDDVAAGAGGWVLDPGTGVPVPSIDAVADPLTGLVAAAEVLEAIRRRAGVLIDIALSRVIGESVGGAVTSVASAAVWHEGWHLPGVDGRPATDAVAVPQRPTWDGDAPAAGADTAAVMTELGF